MSNLTEILIWAAVIAVVFAILWWQGQIRRIADYCRETKAELEKCSWPTWTELKGSTVVIVMTIIGLGVFTIVVDEIFFNLFFKLLK